MQRFCSWVGVASVVGAALVGGSQVAAGPLPGEGYQLIEAELVDRRSGHFEFWHREVDGQGGDRVGSYGALTARSTLPWQLGVGFGTRGEEGVDATAFTNAEWLYLLREQHRDGYGLGLSAGFQYDISNNRRTDHFFVVPVTVDWGKRSTVHANLGGVYDRVADDGHGLWGLGIDWRFTERWDVLLEVSGSGESDDDERGVFGLRRGMFDDLVQFDLVYSRAITSGADEEFYIGLGFDAIRF